MHRSHEMRRVRAEESGLEEWACPTCGRRILLRWPPAYTKQVLEPGDAKACHVGHTADDPTSEPPSEPGTDPAADLAAPTQRQWTHARRWLRETGTEATPASTRTPLHPS